MSMQENRHAKSKMQDFRQGEGPMNFTHGGPRDMNCHKHGEQATICRYCDLETIEKAAVPSIPCVGCPDPETCYRGPGCAKQPPRMDSPEAE